MQFDRPVVNHSEPDKNSDFSLSPRRARRSRRMGICTAILISQTTKQVMPNF